jgi:predicted transcriptional regulator
MSITVDLPDDLSADLARQAQRAGQTAEQFAADALRRQLALQSFRETKERLAPYGEASGLGNDDDALAALS